MMYDCGSCVVKYVLCGFNFLIFVAGTVILAVGLWLLIDMASFIGLLKVVPAEYLQNFTSPAFLQQATYVLIAVGTCMFVISFLGYCGALRESQCMLTLYGFLLILILITEIAVAVIAVVHKSRAEQETKKLLTTSLTHYSGPDHKDAVTAAWDALQTNLKCCGVDSGQDYQINQAWKEQTDIIPQSCCALSLDGKPLDPSCTKSPNDVNSYFRTGCYQGIIDWIMLHTNVVIICAAVLGLIEILGILFSLCLAKSIDRYDK